MVVTEFVDYGGFQRETSMTFAIVVAEHAFTKARSQDISIKNKDHYTTFTDLRFIDDHINIETPG